jgi:hypothetical protein
MAFTIQRSIDAEPAEVWRVISDFARSPGHGVDVRIIEEGMADGTGLLREVSIGSTKITERVDAIDPGRSFSYSIVQGTPTKSYSGRAYVEKTGNQTALTWSGDFVPRIPLTGPIIGIVAKKTVSRYVDAVLLDLMRQS